MERGTRDQHLDGAAPFYDTYACADGTFVAVGCVEPQFFAEMVRQLGLRADDMPAQQDPQGWDAWREVLTETFASRTRDEWAEVFFDSDACVTPVLSPWEAADHPHHVARDSFVEIDGLVQPAPVPRFSRSAPTAPRAPDHDGRDLARTLADWGVPAHHIARLIEGGAVA